MGHEDPFPRPGTNGRCRFGQQTFAGVRGMGETRRLQSFVDRDVGASSRWVSDADPVLPIRPSKIGNYRVKRTKHECKIDSALRTRLTSPTVLMGVDCDASGCDRRILRAAKVHRVLGYIANGQEEIAQIA